MKQLSIYLFLFFIIPSVATAQQITYSQFNNKDNRDMNFEILGKMNGTYIIYKNLSWKHALAIYDDQMNITKTVNLGFIPDKTFNIDFITYPDYFYMIYQYQKNKIVYCMGVKMAADGSKLSEPRQLDTTKLPVLADNKIYNTIYSQDKQKIMVYKVQQRNQIHTIVTKLFDANLGMLDSTRRSAEFDYKREVYKDLYVDNEGNFVFAKGKKKPYTDNIDGLEVFFRRPGMKDYKTITINLNGRYVDETIIKIDNMNRRYLLNSFYYLQERGNIKGLFSMVMDATTMDTIRSAFNVLPDSIRDKANSDGKYKSAFDNFFIRQAIVRKDGGFILTTEDYSSQDRSSTNNSFNRYNYLNNYGYISSNDYYYSPSYGYYRPLSSYSNWQNIRYYYENILILSLDKNLNMEWNNIIPKEQADDDNDNFLSFSTMTVGAEIRFLFSDKGRQIINNQSIQPDGQMKRYATLKSREAGFEFMPRHAKQVGYREVIIPCVYRNYIAFAKVVFAE